VTSSGFALVVPGRLDQRTGGYLYDARIVHELRLAGTHVDVHEVEGRFPDVDESSKKQLHAALGSIPEGSPVVIDGLAMGGAPDVIEAHADRLCIVALVHHPLADETGLGPKERARFEALERDALAHARGVVVTSPYTARRLEAFGVSADRVHAVTPGTDPSPQAEGPSAGDPPLLLCVGTVTPRKGHDVLLRALARIVDLEWRCACAGSLERAPEFVADVLASASRLGLGDRVRFLGELDREMLDSLYRRASLFVLPSHYEGYGMAFAEALARGLPVVGTNGGAIPDTVPDTVGVLVPTGDDEALAEALRSLLASEARRKALTLRARTHAERLPGWAEQARAFAAAVRLVVVDDRTEGVAAVRGARAPGSR